jgi:hypothetical protein
MCRPGSGSKRWLRLGFSRLTGGFSKLKPDPELRVGLGLGLVGKSGDAKFKLKLCH